jgi:hypothetical protein
LPDLSGAPPAEPDFRPADIRFREGFVIHGVRVGIGTADQEILDRLVGLLPPGLTRCDPDTVERRFTLMPVGDSAWHYTSPGGPSPIFADLALVIGMLDSELRRDVAERAPERVFVHAGAVAYRGRGIVIPGRSFSGKSTLVAELVRAGASYYSDEYAVLDKQGLLHPFARPISIRRPRPQPNVGVSVESLGGTIGVEPVPVGMIVATGYKPDATFNPESRSSGQGMLALLAHAARTRDEPEETLAGLRQAVSAADFLEGERGEADAAARALLQLVDTAGSNGATPGR